MTTLYLSGPMTGLPDLNFPAFHAAAAQLRQAGYTVVNPAEIEQADQGNWLACMWTDIAAMAAARVDGVATLPGWDASRGAHAEVKLAWSLGLDVFSVDEWIRARALANAINLNTTAP